MPLRSPQANVRKPPKRPSGAAGSALKPWAARAESGVGRGIGFVAPHARRLNDVLRGAPAVARTLDKVGAVWTRLVEAFCQAIEPLLARRFPELRLVAVADGSGALNLHRLAHGVSTPLGALEAMAAEPLAALGATRWSAVELRLPATQILERRLSLPAASRDFLGPILEHRLDRLTPWRADRVLYGFQIAEEAAPAGMVAVIVTATSRDLVKPSLDRLAAAGLIPTAIGGETEAPELAMAVNLLGGASAAPRAESRRFVSRLALGVGGVLLVATLGSAVLASSAAGERDASAQKLVKARRLLRAATMGAVGSREEALLEAKQPARSTMMLIDQLATSIPADTYLKELTVQPDKVRLVGSSGNAPALVAEIEAAGLSNVRFTSTIARNRDGRDDFELSADRPMPKTAESAP